VTTFNLVEFLEAQDRTYAKAYRLVQSREATEARVVTTTGEVLFRAWGVNHHSQFFWAIPKNGIVIAAPYTQD
jgi:hypothetical protein